MYCDKCGRNNPDGAAFCEECGNKLENTVGENVNTYSNEVPANNGNSNKIIGIIVAVVIVAAAVFGAVKLVGCMGLGVEAPVKNLERAIKKGDINSMMKALPKSYSAELEDEDKEEIEEMLQEVSEFLEDEDVKFSFKVTRKKKLDKDDLKDAQKEENEILKAQDMDKITIKKGYKLTVKVTVKHDGDEENATLKIPVYKIDGRWCITSTGLNAVYSSDIMDALDL